MPLLVVSGASGTGKSTVAPLLAAALPECAVFDVDLLLDAVGGDDWLRFRSAWLSVAHGLAQGGRPTVLCGPLIPGHLRELPERAWVGEAHFATLDCPDDVLRSRLMARPGWRRSRHTVDEQIGFARWLRANVRPCFGTVDRPPAAVVDDLATWARGVLAPTAGRGGPDQ
jgi:predicted kinase